MCSAMHSAGPLETGTSVAEPIPCDVEIVERSRRDGGQIRRWIDVTVNGMPLPTTGTPRVVHTARGTHVGLDLAATAVNIRTEEQ